MVLRPEASRSRGGDAMVFNSFRSSCFACVLVLHNLPLAGPRRKSIC